MKLNIEVTRIPNKSNNTFNTYNPFKKKNKRTKVKVQETVYSYPDYSDVNSTFAGDLMRNLTEKHPWLVGKPTQKQPEKKVIDLTFNVLTPSKPKSIFDVDYQSSDYFNSLNNGTKTVDTIDLYTEFQKAMKRIADWAFRNKYDEVELVFNGKTIRFFDGYIQYGFNIIRYENYDTFEYQVKDNNRVELMLLFVSINKLD